MILGGHLDSTFRGWSATLATRVRLVTARLMLILALPLDFHGRLRVVPKFIPGALHGIEASFLAETGFFKLRAAIVRFVWFRRHLLPILVLCLAYWMVWLGVILRFVLCGSGSVCFVGSVLIGRERLPWSWSCSLAC